MPSKKNHKISTFAFSGNNFFLVFDIVLIIISVISLVLFYFVPKLTSSLIMIIATLGFLPVLFSATKALWHKRLTIDLLASIALIFSFLSQEWESAVFISLMLASARLLASYTDGRTRRAIQSLLKLRPEKVHIKRGEEIVEIDAKDIKIGDLVVVDNGERVAVDGVVVSGSASLDQSSLTGESEPIFKTIGNEVLSSTLNVGGSIVIKTAKIGEDTTFAKTLKLIEESHQSKAQISSIADKFITFYILITLVGSFFFYLYFHNLTKVLSILLVTCADDLAIAIPLAFMAAITVAAKGGIIIKGASYLEGFAKVKAMIFDKTGTITLGKPEVKEIIIFGNYLENEFLSILGSATLESNHPASKAISKFIQEKNIKILNISEIDEKPGYGIYGKIKNKDIFVGRPKFLENKGIIFSQEESEKFEKEKSLGRIIVALAVGKRAIGFVSLSDAVRPQASQVIDSFKQMGIKKIIMLTGDNERVAAQVAKEAHIPEFYANFLPQDKVDFLKKVINKNYKTVMVGDGINDAAALSLADIGVAMGAIGSDVAIESADVALMKDDLKNIADAISLSHYVRRIVRQNFFLWGVLNTLGLVLVFTNILGPVGAAAYNFVTDFIPLINSMRIFKVRFK
jgi:heavy metal translocating P-type ATPase